MALSEKVAIVTGGGKGIGKAISKALAAAGAWVVIAGRDETFLKQTSQEIIGDGGKCMYEVTDITRLDDVKKLIKRTLDNYGGVDILINNGGVGSFGPVESFSIEEFDRVMDTNVKGSFMMSREVIPIFKEQKSGHIIMVTSDVSRRVFANGAIYCASKHAQDALATVIRKEVRSFGIRVGVVLPGLTDTYFNNTQPGVSGKEGWMQPEDVAQAVMFMLQASPGVVVDEITLHPLVQQDY